MLKLCGQISRWSLYNLGSCNTFSLVLLFDVGMLIQTPLQCAHRSLRLLFCMDGDDKRVPRHPGPKSPFSTAHGRVLLRRSNATSTSTNVRLNDYTGFGGDLIHACHATPTARLLAPLPTLRAPRLPHPPRTHMAGCDRVQRPTRSHSRSPR